MYTVDVLNDTQKTPAASFTSHFFLDEICTMTGGDTVVLPIIDLDRYLHPHSPQDREAVIAEVREACQKYGFFQIEGHGVTSDSQNGLFRALNNLFSLPKADKVEMSFLKNPCRRGYEASGMTLRDGDDLPDSKEVRLFVHKTDDIAR
jgi:isopenicillin N synthase-like dioxygenase